MNSCKIGRLICCLLLRDVCTLAGEKLWYINLLVHLLRIHQGFSGAKNMFFSLYLNILPPLRLECPELLLIAPYPVWQLGLETSTVKYVLVNQFNSDLADFIIATLQATALSQYWSEEDETFFLGSGHMYVLEVSGDFESATCPRGQTRVQMEIAVDSKCI